MVLRGRLWCFTLARMRISGPFLTWPNVLSLSRLLALPLFLWLVSTPGHTGWAIGLLLYAVVSDLADGYLARRLNAQSEWGRILDPVADKIASAAALIFCYFQRDLPAWILALILGRDLLILAFSPWWASRHGRIPESLWWGRVAALSTAGLALVYLFELKSMQNVFLLLTTGLILISAWQYARRLRTYAG